MAARVIFVVAHDRNRVMGHGGALPWHLPADLQHFKSLTLGKPVIMGRKTYDAIGRPLPKRRNIVLSRNATTICEGIETARTIGDVFAMTAGEPEIAIIGGAEIFNAFSPYVHTAYVTLVEAEVEGDVYYDPPRRPFVLAQTGAYDADERNAVGMRFLRYDYANAAVTGGSAKESKPSA